MMMPTAMADALGYDEHGNNPALLAPEDDVALSDGTWRRASGEVECRCGSLYRQHPRVQGALWLIRTCEGIIKP